MAESKSEEYMLLDSFSISPGALCSLFDIDSIRTRESLKLLENMRGIEGILHALRSHSTQGISGDEIDIQQRKKVFGDNHPYIQPTKTFFAIVWEVLKDTILRILICAAIVSLIVGLLEDPAQGWMDGCAILVAIVIVVTVAASNDYLKDKQFRKLNSETGTHIVQIVRGGKDMQLESNELLVGDIVQVFSGSLILADGILVKGHGITVDESSITGESDLIRKEDNPFLISGSTIAEGKGLMLVCAVGKNSVQGKNKHMLLLDQEDDTPLSQKLEKIAGDIGKAGFSIAGILFLGLLIWTIVNAVNNGEWDSRSWHQLINAVTLSIIIIVVAVPEGLPLAVTLCLAYSVRKMKNENNFVRHLKACETMGSATDILSDKTGTLTMNKMTVTHTYFFGKDDQISLTPEERHFISECASRNSSAGLDIEKNEIIDVGNRTECALLRMIIGWELDYRSFRDIDKELSVSAFSHTSKKMTTVYREDNYLKIYTKGAPEVILSLCSKIKLPNGDISELTPEHTKNIIEKGQHFSSHLCLRVLAFAYTAIKDTQRNEELEMYEVEKDLIFLGFVGIQDPIRPEIAEVVRKVQRAGINVRMVTGDGKETATHIAKLSGILPEVGSNEDLRQYVIEGSEFRRRIGGIHPKIDEKGKADGFEIPNMLEFSEIVSNLRVIARCSPEDKLALVVGLKNLGKVVAVTGDGSNDAPALKKSDVGLAMMSGTALAKESADIILLDDNFKSVSNSVKWGRNIYASIRKFLQFQLTVNITALGISVIGSIALQASPLSSVQMLWVNLLMDSFGALALATEPPSEALLKGPPHGRDDYVINKDMKFTIATQSIFQLAVLLALLFGCPYMLDIKPTWEDTHYSQENYVHFTIVFNTFVMLQFFNEINCRKLSVKELNVFRGFFNNSMFVIILIGTMIVQILIIEFGGRPLHTSPLTVGQHALCIGLGMLAIPWTLLAKSILKCLRKQQGGHQRRSTSGSVHYSRLD